MANAIIQTVAVNSKGLVRGNNEDNFYLDGTYMHRDKMDDGAFITGSCKNQYQLYAVCDGMGGAAGGEDASFCAVSELARRKDDYKSLTDREALTEALREISEKVYTEAEARREKSGTTIAMALVDGTRLHISNVGDSRVYRLKSGILTQMSEDHSRVQRMVNMGLMTPEQARVDPSRHVISQYLGMPTDVKISPYIDSSETLNKGDMYLLCSDGLSDMVEDRVIESIMKNGKDLSDMAQQLVRTALKNGGRDNVTVMLLKVVQVSEESSIQEGSAGNGALRTVLTAAQVLIGAGLAATVADAVWYLIH